jgi:hypothetical protein
LRVGPWRMGARSALAEGFEPSLRRNRSDARHRTRASPRHGPGGDLEASIVKGRAAPGRGRTGALFANSKRVIRYRRRGGRRWGSAGGPNAAKPPGHGDRGGFGVLRGFRRVNCRLVRLCRPALRRRRPSADLSRRAREVGLRGIGG